MQFKLEICFLNKLRSSHRNDCTQSNVQSPVTSMCKETLSIYFSIRRYTLKSVRQVKRIINTQPRLLPYKSVHFSFGLVIEEHGVDQSFFFLIDTFTPSHRLLFWNFLCLVFLSFSSFLTFTFSFIHELRSLSRSYPSVSHLLYWWWQGKGERTLLLPSFSRTIQPTTYIFIKT